MNENTANTTNLSPVRVEKQIGNTTYIATASFNGDENHEKSIVRLIVRDCSKSAVTVPKT